jgi:hypothetical protein
LKILKEKVGDLYEEVVLSNKIPYIPAKDFYDRETDRD